MCVTKIHVDNRTIVAAANVPSERFLVTKWVAITSTAATDGMLHFRWYFGSLSTRTVHVSPWPHPSGLPHETVPRKGLVLPPPSSLSFSTNPTLFAAACLSLPRGVATAAATLVRCQYFLYILPLFVFHSCTWVFCSPYKWPLSWYHVLDRLSVSTCRCSFRVAIKLSHVNVLDLQL
jgi:hypothetical protein